jgi:hypothetical protein
MIFRLQQFKLAKESRWSATFKSLRSAMAAGLIFSVDSRHFALKRRERTPVTQISNLLCRRASSLRYVENAKNAEPATLCRLEIGDTAGWKPALQRLAEAACANCRQISGLGVVLALLVICQPLLAAPLSLSDPDKEEKEAKFYRIEPVSIPKEINLEVGGMAFRPDGALMICTRRGEVWSLKENHWNRFAAGLDEPMGLLPVSQDEVIVAQRCELTRLVDLDHDGSADRFETMKAAWNYSGHPYEWTFGPVRDRNGNLFCGLSCWMFPTQPMEKSPYMGWELPTPSGYTPDTNTAWRGWCFKITPKGEFIPWAYGLRSPNGFVFDQDGELFVTDNQGEYCGADVLLHVKEGAFYGHPTALYWGPSATKTPFSIPLEVLDQHRTPAVIYFPYKLMGQSASEPVFDTTEGKFGPFAGQMFVGDASHSTVMRVTLEKVGGEFQGACYPFRRGFRSGNNRAAFAKDGSLWIGETSRGWGSVGGSVFGLERLIWTGTVPFEILKMELTSDGFDLTFTKPIDRVAGTDPRSYRFQRYLYQYMRSYFAPQSELAAVKVNSVTVSEDGKKVSLALAELVPGKIYELNLRGLAAADGTEAIHSVAYYTLNRLRQK